jgi:hypothetical protein
MSESCEEEILRKAEEASVQPEITMKTRKKHSPAMIAAAACLCAAVAGTVTVSAVQEKGWLVDMFKGSGYVTEEERSDTAYQEELYDAAEEYFSEISNFEATGKYAESVTPVGAVCDGRGLYVAVSYTPEQPEGMEAYSGGGFSISGNPATGMGLYCGDSRIELNGAHGGGTQQADGSQLVWMMFRAEESFTGDTVHVELPVTQHTQYLKDDKVMGESDEQVLSVSFDVDISKKAKTVSYKVQETLRHEVEVMGVAKCFHVEEIRLSALYMTLKGDQANSNNTYNFEDAFYAITKDGEEIKCELVSGILGRPDSEHQLSYEKPVDPADIVAIKAGDKIIELN